ncbi:MAG TPA: metallophosphoesterase family protein [Caldimonas sp.]|nr:metallophosphoesterase family protein [Caldimonas sp.]HEX2541915.1 metallophosphoesterase family protein [Caldimonas sp.]
MRTLVHLSDLHFGRTDPAVVAALPSTVAAIRPDVTVVSGDLTQRAKAKEFEQARAFLDGLPAPKIVVPGNHDVPLYRVWERFLSPLGKYLRYIQDDLNPCFIDDEIAVLGINTARSLTFKNGRINQGQMRAIHQRFDPLPEHLTKIVVTHHPFDLPDEPDNAELVGRARQAMKVFADCGVDLLLAGHFHTTQAGDTSGRHELPGYSALVVQAGTATSTRGRGESNSFNVVRVDGPAIAVETWAWQPERSGFFAARVDRFAREGARWVERGGAAPAGQPAPS